MALVVKDRVQETSTTTGTGTITLAGAVTGFQSFSAIGNGNTTYYAVVGGTEWEVGIGTYTALGTTLSRDTILASSNGGSAVNFSAGTKNVFVTYPADKSIYDDAAGNVIALGTPASVTLTNGTGLPISTGVSGLGTGVATFLATPSSANLASAITDETGSGSLVFATSPTLTTPVLGTPSSGTLTNCTFPTLNQNTTGTAANVTGTVAVANGGTNQTSYTNGQLLIGNTTGNTLAKATLTAGTGISVTNGAGSITIANSAPSVSWQSVQTTGFTAVSSNGYPCNTTSAAFTVTLPASPTAGDAITLTDYAGTWQTNNLTVSPNGNNLNGLTSNAVFSTKRQSISLVYIDATQGWIPFSGFLDSIPVQPVTASYLVVAGGGGGGCAHAGGGGAGGMRTGTANLTLGSVYTATIGGGGAGSTSNGSRGSNGVNSSLSGSGLTTITSTGGGGGGSRTDSNSDQAQGAAGGSGGGGGGQDSGWTPTPTGGAGTAGQGNAGGYGGILGGGGGVTAAGGGGGGAGAVGGNAGNGPAGNGGAGSASSITGSSVTYAGGGGGGVYVGNTAGTGGAGGGGTGAGSSAGSAGTANTGGGGGGGASAGGSGGGVGLAGGSGVVILSVPTANYTGTTTGSPTITTSGFNTIIKFTGTGTYTA
jgi:hypothetical protein